MSNDFLRGAFLFIDGERWDARRVQDELAKRDAEILRLTNVIKNATISIVDLQNGHASIKEGSGY